MTQLVYKAAMQQIDKLIKQYVEKERLPNSYVVTAQKWFIPLCQSLALHHNEAKSYLASKPFFVGINGCQGSGKSTLSGLLNFLLNEHFNKKSIVISLDDFYYKKSERKALSDQVHPLLSTRGVPGTHDTQLMQQVFTAISKGQSADIPTFDKSIDDRALPEHWQHVTEPLDIIIVEGWCWGTPPQNPEQLATPVNKLEKTQDPKGEWRNYVNNMLQRHYVPLFAMMDKWIFLQAPSFDAVYSWRCQQEHKLIQRLGYAKNIMSDEEILNFIQYYQRLTEHTLRTLGSRSEWIFELDNERKIIKSSQYDR